MLIRFGVENFRSFNEQTFISLVANGRITRLKHHTIEYDDLNLLRGAYVYGANASGKSNLIRAVKYAKDLIKEGSTSDLQLDQYCKLGAGNAVRPGVFQFEMVINGKIYSYGFALSYQTGKIVEEWLYELYLSGKERKIFARDENEVSSELGLKGQSKARFEIYSDDIKVQPKTLFLAELAKKFGDEDFRIFDLIYRWFEKVIVIFPDSVYEPLPIVIRDSDMRRQLEKFLVHMDTGIDSIKIDATTLEKELSYFPREIAAKLHKDILQQLSEHKEFGIRGDSELMTVSRNDKGEMVMEKLRTSHEGSQELFDLKDESDGTQRLFYLIPLLSDSIDDCVVFIDEIDRSMHPKLTVEFINLFYEYTASKRMQMIATTHESAVLDLNLIRQDEIWFMERQGLGSKLYSLDDFKVRYDKQIEKDYLLGRYGAVPLFSAFDTMQVSED